MTKDDGERQKPGLVLHSVAALAPHLLWALVVLVFFFVIGADVFRDLLSRTSKIGTSTFGVEFLTKATDAKDKTIEISPVVRDQLKSRFEDLKPLVASSRILWADDNPPNNRFLIEFLNGLGVSIDLAVSAQETCKRLEGAVYDVVISDMTRSRSDGSSNADGGLSSLQCASQAVLKPSVIFYTGQNRDTPFGAFGLTNRPDVLLNLYLDALEAR